MHRSIPCTGIITPAHLDLGLLLAKKAWLLSLRVLNQSVRPTLMWRHLWHQAGGSSSKTQSHGTASRLNLDCYRRWTKLSGEGQSHCSSGTGIHLPSQSPSSSRSSQPMSPKLFVPWLCLHSSPFFIFPGNMSGTDWCWTIILGAAQLNLCCNVKKL